MRWILVGLLLIASSSVVAQQAACGDRKKILEYLERKYEEVVKYSAVGARGELVEWTVASGGSWSMLVTTSIGMTCVVGTGEGWREHMRVKGTVA